MTPNHRPEGESRDGGFGQLPTPRELCRTLSLPRVGKVILVALVMVLSAANLVLGWGDWKRPGPALVSALVILVLALFAWRPWLPAFLLPTLACIALATGSGASDSVFLTLATGLVAYTCSSYLTFTYMIATLLVVLGAELMDPMMNEGGSFVAVILMLTSGLIGYALRQGRDRERLLRGQAVTAVQDERNRIADELHDVIAHDLTVVVMHARALQRSEDAATRAHSLEAVLTAAEQALTDTRRTMRIFQGSGESSQSGEVAVVHDVCAQIREKTQQLVSAGFAVDVDVPTTLDVSQSVATTLWHVVNECVTNVLKHSGPARRVRFELTSHGDYNLLEVWNEASSPSSQPRKGRGIARMAERVALLDGVFSATPADGGWLVTVTLPSE